MLRHHLNICFTHGWNNPTSEGRQRSRPWQNQPSGQLLSIRFLVCGNIDTAESELFSGDPPWEAPLLWISGASLSHRSTAGEVLSKSHVQPRPRRQDSQELASSQSRRSLDFDGRKQFCQTDNHSFLTSKINFVASEDQNESNPSMSSLWHSSKSLKGCKKSNDTVLFQHHWMLRAAFPVWTAKWRACFEQPWLHGKSEHLSCKWWADGLFWWGTYCITIFKHTTIQYKKKTCISVMWCHKAMQCNVLVYCN